MNYFSISELNPHKLPLTPEITKNLELLISKLNSLREVYGKPMIVNSGYRDKTKQTEINPAAMNSKHCFGLAADIRDIDNSLMNCILQNLELAKNLDLFFEDFRYTAKPTAWCHIQVGQPKNGNRIYIPYSGKPDIKHYDGNRWNGNYDHKFNIS